MQKKFSSLLISFYFEHKAKPQVLGFELNFYCALNLLLLSYCYAGIRNFAKQSIYTLFFIRTIL